MQSNAEQGQKQAKGFLGRPVKVWKPALSLWLALVAGSCVLSCGPASLPTVTPSPTDAPVSTETSAPTEEPTETPVPSETPTPTGTPVPTDTPMPTEEPTATATPTQPVARVMYFCGYDLCRGSLDYGTLIFETGINVWNRPDPDRGGVHHRGSHHDQVTVVEERRVRDGPGGLWYRLQRGGWTNDYWLTEGPCTRENLQQYSQDC